MPQGRSRIEIRRVAARGRAMPSQRNDVLAILGVFNWGPMNTATEIIDYPDAVKKFGTHLASYDALLHLKLWFEGGGRFAIVTRVCHITDHTSGNTPTSAAKATYMLKTAAGGTYSEVNTLKVDALYYGTRTLQIKVQEATNAETAQFDLIVYCDGELVEWHRNLSMDDTNARYVEDIINTSSEKSDYIRVTDQDVGGVDGAGADQLPDALGSAVTLTGGDDGETSLDDNDYIGGPTYRTGLYAFNLVSDGDMLICPERTTTTFQNAATTYCQNIKQGKMIFFPEVPEGTLTKEDVKVHVQALTASEYRTAPYWPHVKIANPNKAIYGVAPQITVSPVAMICARIATNSENEESVQFTQPGNEIYGLLDSAVGLETDIVLDPTLRDYLTDYGINCIISGIRQTDGNFGVWADDVQLGKLTDNLVSVGEAHGVSMLLRKHAVYLEQHRTQNNTSQRRRTIKEALEADLLIYAQKGCFASKNPEEAYYVETDPDGLSLNNPLVQDNQELYVMAAVATARPGRFIYLLFTRDSRAIESYLQRQLTATSST
jgi:hypothetical protein